MTVKESNINTANEVGATPTPDMELATHNEDTSVMSQSASTSSATAKVEKAIKRVSRLNNLQVAQISPGARNRRKRKH